MSAYWTCEHCGEDNLGSNCINGCKEPCRCEELESECYRAKVTAQRYRKALEKIMDGMCRPCEECSFGCEHIIARDALKEEV